MPPVTPSTRGCFVDKLAAAVSVAISGRGRMQCSGHPCAQDRCQIRTRARLCVFLRASLGLMYKLVAAKKTGEIEPC